MNTPATPHLSGLWLPVITPFREGRVDIESFARVIEHYLGQPIDGMIVAATTGEGLTLDEAETAVLAETAADIVGGRIPLYLGLAGSDTAHMAETIRRTETWRIGGYLISCPCYSRPSQDGLHDHFAALAAVTDRPLVLYNIPYRTGVNLLNETLLRLARIPNVVGLKDCCTDLAQTFDLLRHKPGDFSVMTGEDVQLYSALVHGAEGAILASAHVETARFAAVRAHLADGYQQRALEEWSGLVDLTRLLFAEPSPAAIKHWLWRQGLIESPELRLPMTGASEGLAARIDVEMAARGILESEQALAS